MARLFWRFMLLTLKNVALSDRPKLNCSVTAATSQHFKVANCAAKQLPRASKAAQRFCIPLQVELSCYLASKMLLNSCNLAVQLFWRDFVALYSAASFVRETIENLTITKSSFLGYVYTILDSYVRSTKTHLFTHEKDDFSTISVTEQNCAVPISKVECHIPDSQ